MMKSKLIPAVLVVLAGGLFGIERYRADRMNRLAVAKAHLQVRNQAAELADELSSSRQLNIALFKRVPPSQVHEVSPHFSKLPGAAAAAGAPPAEATQKLSGALQAAQERADQKKQQADTAKKEEQEQVTLLGQQLSVATWVRLILTAVIIVIGLPVLFLAKFDASVKHWASGALGTVLGFWFGGGLPG